MRVITGSARGRRLVTLEGESVRPTADRVKEAMFSAIQFEIEGRSVLDLFAGSGQLAVEALSRGAAKAVLVDAAKASLAVAEKNLTSTGLRDRARLVNSDFAAYLSSCRERFDLVFLDPPYHTGLLQRALPAVEKLMNPGGTILCEHPLDETLPDAVGAFTKYRSHKYGKIMVTLYRREAEEGRENR